MSGNIPDSEKNEFNSELIDLNFDRSRILNHILLSISLILLLIDVLNMQKGLFISGPRYLFYTHFLLMMITLILLPYLRIKRGTNPKQAQFKLLFVILFAYFVTLVLYFYFSYRSTYSWRDHSIYYWGIDHCHNEYV